MHLPQIVPIETKQKMTCGFVCCPICEQKNYISQKMFKQLPWLWRLGRREAWVGKESVWPLHVEWAADPQPLLIFSPPARELCPSWEWCEGVSRPRHSGPEAGSPASRLYLPRMNNGMLKCWQRRSLFRWGVETTGVAAAQCGTMLQVHQISMCLMHTLKKAALGGFWK